VKRKTRENFIKSIQTLMKGFPYKKFGLGMWAIFQPQSRRLVFTSNMESFAFVKTHVFHQNATKFFRFTTLSKERMEEKLRIFSGLRMIRESSFSIIMKSRTIDLEARNAPEKERIL